MRRLVASPFGAFPLVALGFTLLVGGCVLWARPQLERITRQQVANELMVTRDACASAVALWFGTARQAARLAIADAEVGARARRCLSGDGACEPRALAARLRLHTEALGLRDIVLADRQGRVRASDGTRAAERELPRELVLETERLADGDVAVLPAVFAQGRPALWVATPIAEAGGRLGVLLIELPFATLEAVLHVARSGASGETYAFDRSARFVSQSRFTPQLQRAGLLERATTSAVLAVDVRDPGVDLTDGSRAALPRAQQPLTRMARDAVAGGAGIDVDGYRDYRGVRVVGAWRWLPEFGLGIATEVDYAEAFAATVMLRRLFLSLLAILALSCIALLAGAVFIGRLRDRALRAQVLADRFGQYRIVRKLGEGGMGAVYLADHEVLRRPAVIKLVRPDRMTRESIARFEREVQLTSTLKHPNTVAVYDYGLTDAGTPYYVMEYLHGLDLEQLVKRFGPLPQERVIHFLRQLCGSLAEAHAAPLVHRDIKPANLFLCRRVGAADTLKVLDFGIAKSIAPAPGGLTESRLALGTPEYMAPELFESAASASPQSDLYAVGCVAYFLLTGSQVFDGESAHDLGMAHLVHPPELPSKRLQAPIDGDLEAAILACLAKRRDARPKSAAALRALLDQAAVAHAWNEARAEAWWTEHGAAIDALHAEQAAGERPPTLKRLRPQRIDQAALQRP